MQATAGGIACRGAARPARPAAVADGQGSRRATGLAGNCIQNCMQADSAPVCGFARSVGACTEAVPGPHRAAPMDGRAVGRTVASTLPRASRCRSGAQPAAASPLPARHGSRLQPRVRSGSALRKLPRRRLARRRHAGAPSTDALSHRAGRASGPVPKRRVAGVCGQWSRRVRHRSAIRAPDVLRSKRCRPVCRGGWGCRRRSRRGRCRYPTMPRGRLAGVAIGGMGGHAAGAPCDAGYRDGLRGRSPGFEVRRGAGVVAGRRPVVAVARLPVPWPA